MPLFHRTAFLERSKIGQIGTLGGYIHFLITICENSNKSILNNRGSIRDNMINLQVVLKTRGKEYDI